MLLLLDRNQPPTGRLSCWVWAVPGRGVTQAGGYRSVELAGNHFRPKNAANLMTLLVQSARLSGARALHVPTKEFKERAALRAGLGLSKPDSKSI